MEICGKVGKTDRIRMIRDAEKESHEQVYSSKELFQKGSWLEKPVKTVMETLPFLNTSGSFWILDLGCGVGRNAIPIARRLATEACKIDCVDILPLAIEKLRENAECYGVSGAVRGIVSSIEAFLIPQESYDLIVAVSALEHVENAQVFEDKLREIWQGLRKGGIACLILNSDVHEYDPVTECELAPQLEVNLPTETLEEMLAHTFQGEILVQKVCPQKYDIPRGKRIVKLTTKVVTLAVRKDSQA